MKPANVIDVLQHDHVLHTRLDVDSSRKPCQRIMRQPRSESVRDITNALVERRKVRGRG